MVLFYEDVAFIFYIIALCAHQNVANAGNYSLEYLTSMFDFDVLLLFQLSLERCIVVANPIYSMKGI